jgi:hypothetical protein
MRNKSFEIIVLFVFFLFFSIGCKKGKKDDSVTTTQPLSTNISNTINEIGSFLSRKASPSQTFSINNSVANNLVTANQTTINIPPGTFLDTISGTYPANVVVTVREAFTFKDFICNNLITVTTAGDLLNSAGMIYLGVNFGTNNMPLFQVKKLQIKYYSPNVANNIYNTQVFNLNGSSNTWSLNTQSSSSVYYDSAIVRNIYSLINIANLGWINCDALYSCPNLFSGQNFLFKTTGNYTTSNTKVIFIISFPSCGASYGRTSLFCNGSFTNPQEFYYPNSIPANSSIKAIAISKINSQWYYEVQPTTIIQNSSMTFTNMQLTDSVQVLSVLNSL